MTEIQDLRHCIDRFLDQRRARGYSEATLCGDRKRLRYLLLFADRAGLHNVRDLTRETVRECVQFIREYRKKDGTELTPGSREIILIELRLFLRFLAQSRLILFDGSLEIPKQPSSITLPRPVLTSLQVERVLSLPDVSTPEGLRDRAVLELLYSAGLRRAELCGLLLEDVTMSTGLVYVRQGKGRRDRMVPAGERALSWLRRYIAEGRPLLLAFAKTAKLSKDHGYLFFNRYGRACGVSTLTTLAGGYLRRSGIEQGACHIFRHTAATLMLENGADVRYIQEFLGHANLKTTQVYTKVSGKHLRETFKRSHPAVWSDEPALTPARTIPRTKILRKRPHGRGIKIPDVDGTESPLHASIAEYGRMVLSLRSKKHTHHITTYLLWFAEWCMERGYRVPGRITTEILEKYQKDLTVMKERRRDRTISVNEQILRMRAVRDLFRYLSGEGKIFSDPASSIILPRKSKYLPPEPLTLEEVNRLLALPDVQSPYGLRDRAMMELLFATGLRRQELVQLRLSDLDFERSMVRIRGAKTGDERNIPAGDRCFKWLGRYIEAVRPHLLVSDDPGNVFLASHGAGMEVGLPHVLLRRYFHLAGLKKKSLVHVFRHTAATLMLENGADIRMVQEFLGHRSIHSTERYTHVTTRKLKEVHAKTHPGEKGYLERMREATP